MNFTFKTNPLPQQLEALQKSHKLRYFAFFMEAGTGKSKIILDEARWAYDTGRIDTLVVLCPNGIQQNWILDQVPKHLAGEYVAAYWRSGMRASEKKEWLAATKATGKLRVLALNFDVLLNTEMYTALKTVIRKNKVMLVLDESHRIKTPRSKRTKAAINLGVHAVARRIATGTPAPNNPLDLYSQLKFLSPTITGHKTSASFKADHAIIQRVELKTSQGGDKMGRDYFNKIIGYRGLKELDAKLDPYCYRKKLRDCVELPPLIINNYYVVLSPQQERMYEELREIAATSIKECPPGLTADQRILWAVENVDVVAQNQLVGIIRMQQVLSGYVKDDHGDIHAVENNRVKDLINLLEDLEGKTIVWTQGISELEYIAEELRTAGYKVVTYYGKTKPQERTAAINDFQTGDATIFLGQPKAGGIGITLTAARNMVWYSVGYNFADYAQGQGRFERIGQTQPMRMYHMVSRGTLDIAILRVINKKRATQDTLIWRTQDDSDRGSGSSSEDFDDAGGDAF